KGVELYGRVGDFSSKGYLVRKSSPGSDELMRKLARYDDIELCGVETDVDVLANAVVARAANPSANVIVRQNCVASRNTDLSEFALDIMNGMGIKVM
ncbi:MAG: isochorismatase family protein, partial [Candidatus Methanomethylophilaceae archaeon]|nr:isochorismatase family protein [Candidatus Methanomethylophilaceae archaeon]